MQNREDTAIARRVKEFVAVPTRGERAGFGFAIANNAGDDQVGLSNAAP
jgi:hypothetical protein